MGQTVRSRGIVTIEAAELWQQFAGFELFASFTEEERLSFILAFEREALMCVRRFASGELVWRRLAGPFIAPTGLLLTTLRRVSGSGFLPATPGVSESVWRVVSCANTRSQRCGQSSDARSGRGRTPGSGCISEQV